NKDKSLNYFIIEGNFDAFCCHYRGKTYGKIYKITRMDLLSHADTPRRVLRPLLNAAVNLLDEGISREKVSRLVQLPLDRINEYIPDN
ncbi:MAG: hypothetical protein AAGA60_06020, partial [Cyanobacteria bacterium P01_E01_bin.42]